MKLQLKNSACLHGLGSLLLSIASLSTSAQSPPFWATGEHQCQSETDIGHTCESRQWDVADCGVAYAKLAANDCCPSTRRCNITDGVEECELGGTSIGFVLKSCTPFIPVNTEEGNE